MVEECHFIHRVINYLESIMTQVDVEVEESKTNTVQVIQNQKRQKKPSLLT